MNMPKMKTSQRSISQFLTIQISIVFMVIVGVGLPVSYAIVKNNTNREINVIADQYLIAISEIIQDPVKNEDLPLIEDILNSFKSNPYINSIRVVDQDHNDILSFNKNQMGRLIYREKTINNPIQQDVVVSLEISDQLFVKRNNQIFQITSIILTASLFISLISIWLIAKFFISRPLNQIIKEFKRLS